MNVTSEHVQTLKMELNGRRAKNQAYSLRAFAKHLGLDAGSLSRILNGKQDLSLRSAILIVRKLDFDPERAKRFLTSVADQKIREITAALAQAARISSSTNEMPEATLQIRDLDPGHAAARAMNYLN